MVTRDFGRFRERIASETPESFAESVSKLVLFQANSPPRDEWHHPIFHGSTPADLKAAIRSTAKIALKSNDLKKARTAFLLSESIASTDASSYERLASSRLTAAAAVSVALDTKRERMRAKLGPASWRISKDVTWDVELVASLLSIRNMKPRVVGQCLEYALSRLEVWEKGYILLADINGVFYVYRINDDLGDLARKVQ